MEYLLRARCCASEGRGDQVLRQAKGTQVLCKPLIPPEVSMRGLIYGRKDEEEEGRNFQAENLEKQSTVTGKV